MGNAATHETVCCISGTSPLAVDHVTAGPRVVTTLSALERVPGIEPVGQVFEETCSLIPALDRQLLIFCGSSSVVAVRWLLLLGASIDATDTSGTTCLHAACRSGTLSVLVEILRRAPSSIDRADDGGWTPLHIAAHMGRREVVARLLQAGARPLVRNQRGLTPIDLCIDAATLAALKREEDPVWAAQGGLGAASRSPSSSSRQPPSPDVWEDSVGTPRGCEPECFLVMPRAAVKVPPHRRPALLQIAVDIFRSRPSHGLAFAVATGLAESYSVAVRMFAHQDATQAASFGSFLGEAFSVCTPIRFSLFDAVPMLHTGVLRAMIRGLGAYRLPEDLVKVDRLVRSLAQVWWRKHTALAKDIKDCTRFGGSSSSKDCEWWDEAGGLEETSFCGLTLQVRLGSCEVLYQVMLSTLLLHWYVHGSDGRTPRVVPCEVWVEMHRGLERESADTLEDMLGDLHTAVCDRFLPELALAGDAPRTPKEVACTIVHTIRQNSSGVACHTTAEGWVRFLGPVPWAAFSACEHSNMPTCHSPSAEVSPHMARRGIDILRRGCEMAESGTGDDAEDAAPKGSVWARLCDMWLLLSTSPDVPVPHAFVDARSLAVLCIDPAQCVVTLSARPRPPTPVRSSELVSPVGDVGAKPIATVAAAVAAIAVSARNGVDAGVAGKGREPEVVVVELLPDGRWHEACVAEIRLKVADVAHLEMWTSKLRELHAQSRRDERGMCAVSRPGARTRTV